MIREFAPAKVNLTLHVVGRRDDGYHLLDSVVTFADVGDEVIVGPAEDGASPIDLQVEVTGPTAPAIEQVEGAPLTVRTAAELLASRLSGGAPASTLRLDKHLPVAAGIGGGSADAAAALRALNRAWDMGLSEDALAEIGVEIGADVPVCVAGRPTRMTGIGEVLERVTGWPSLPALLVNPGVPTPTGPIFKALHASGSPFDPAPPAPPRGADAAGAIAYLRSARNSLEAPARQLTPKVGGVLTALEGVGADLARMSGSGATCFGLFVEKETADSAAERLAAAHPSWWVRSTVLAGSS